jgi:hypothetical protein
MDENLYEISSESGQNIYPLVKNEQQNYLSVNEGSWGGVLIDDSVLDKQMYSEPYKKYYKSREFDPNTGNYTEVQHEVRDEDQVAIESDVSRVSDTINYGSYSTKMKPKPPASKWKKISTVDNVKSQTTQQSHQQQSNTYKTCTNDFCVCPICNTAAVSICNCENRDSLCKNGHMWHVKNNTRQMGNTHSQQVVNQPPQYNNHQHHNHNKPDGCVIC